MRLLHFNDDDSLSLVEFLGNDIPPFAILSHTWYSDSEEYNFQDVVRGTGEERRGYQKVQFCGQQAKRDGLQYFWVDTCCIDKSSSAELTEAINSMFRWYQESEKCYVYLSDVMCYSNGPDDGANRWKSAFGGSKWFTRGWTLQELIAPRSVSFFSQEGQLLGDKCSLLQTLHEITGITFKALQGDSLSEFGVEERFAWAANRHTKREEDAVYSLLGIFSVYLPLIYGEGKDNALARLRREISGVPSKTNMEKEERAKIFAWLSAPDPSTNYNKALKQLLKGTGLWFLEGQEFAKWKTEDSSLLWLHGIPGSGKTILSSAIVQNLLDEDRIVGTSIKAYFFFDFKDTQKQDPDLMLRSLLSQMSQQCESMYTSLHTLYRSCEDGQRQPSTDALTRAIQRGVNKNRQAYIVFDALDECAQRTELMQMITTMIEWRFTGWHLLMTSRKEREIESYLEELLDCKNTLSLKSHLVNHDIRHYVQKRLSEDKTLRKWAEDQSIREEIEEALMEGAQGMFRWALCQLDTLGACRNKVMLRRALKTLPPTLDATYDRILNAISEEDCDYAIRILRWLTYSCRPLTVEELATFIAIDVDSAPAFDPDQVCQDPLEVLHICSSLVSIRDSSIDPEDSSRDISASEGRNLSKEVVELAHYSVKEYLTSERLTNLLSARYRMNDAKCQAILASSCILYLLRREADMHSDDMERMLARYPSEYWKDHMHLSDPRPEALNHLVARLLTDGTAAYRRWFSRTSPLEHAIEWGYTKVAQIILERGDTIYRTAFKDALYFKRREIAFLLIEHNATLDNCLYMIRNWEDKELETAWRNKQRDTVLALIESGAEPDRALSAACELDDEELAAVLIHPNLSIQLQGSELEKACIAGSGELIRMLLENGPEVADPIAKTRALQTAYINKNWAIFKDLLRFDAEINLRDDETNPRGYHISSCRFRTYVGMEEECEDLVKLLHKYGASESTVERFFTNLLYSAAVKGCTELVAKLVDKGVDVNVQGGNHGNALRAAIGRGHKDVVKILREAGAYAWKPGH